MSANWDVQREEGTWAGNPWEQAKPFRLEQNNWIAYPLTPLSPKTHNKLSQPRPHPQWSGGSLWESVNHFSCALVPSSASPAAGRGNAGLQGWVWRVPQGQLSLGLGPRAGWRGEAGGPRLVASSVGVVCAHEDVGMSDGECCWVTVSWGKM